MMKFTESEVRLMMIILLIMMTDVYHECDSHKSFTAMPVCTKILNAICDGFLTLLNSSSERPLPI